MKKADNFEPSKWLVENKITFQSKLNEETNKGNYNRALEVFQNYEDEEILKDFLSSFPKNQDIDKNDFFKFAEKHYDDMSELSDTKNNWEYITTGQFPDEEE